MLLYPLAYAVIWSLPTVIRIYQTTTSQPAPWQLQTVDKVCIVVQGLVDAIIYGATEQSLSSWRELLGAKKRPLSLVVSGEGGLRGSKGGSKHRGSVSGNYWHTRTPTAGEQQLTRISTAGDDGDGGTLTPRAADDTATHRSTSSSGPSSDFSPDLTAAAGSDSGGHATELCDLRQRDTVGSRSANIPALRIQKTVQIEVVRSESVGQDQPSGLLEYQRPPPRAYLPFQRNLNPRGSFLDG